MVFHVSLDIDFDMFHTYFSLKYSMTVYKLITYEVNILNIKEGKSPENLFFDRSKGKIIIDNK